MKTKLHQVIGPIHQLALAILLASLPIIIIGCRGTPEKKNTEFFTSGSRDADQRASQRMARDEQLQSTGEGTGEKKVKKAEKSNSDGSTNKAAQVEGKLTLYDRLGGEQGITDIVNDFTPRMLQDPRVNFPRTGIKRGGFSFQRNQSVTWQATPENVAQLKKHFVQFISLASGGPANYDGKDLNSAHADMHITNAEFDAVVGDLKASLDKLKIPDKEQKELIAIVESTRPQIVTVR